MTATGETTMREMPIVFAAEDVRATLAGRKTQYRRPLSARNCLVDGVSMSAKRWAAMRWDWGNAWVDGGPSPAGNSGPYLHVLSLENWTTHRIYPRVRPGDLLWVRETFCPIYSAVDGRIIEVDYRATYTHGDRLGDSLGIKKRWSPSIHMPREASRIDLEVTGVRVERLQDISDADAVAEGCAIECMRPAGSDNGTAIWSPGGFVARWESINGPGSWGANPWVWVVDFARLPG